MPKYLTPGKMWFTTQEILEWVGITKQTFSVYKKLLGIQAHRGLRDRNRNYYTFWDLMKIAELHKPPRKCYRKRLRQRLELLERLKNEGRERQHA